MSAKLCKVEGFVLWGHWGFGRRTGSEPRCKSAAPLSASTNLRNALVGMKHGWYHAAGTLGNNDIPRALFQDHVFFGQVVGVPFIQLGTYG